ncbi:TetR/AcrR family transcriptional regulator [Paenibacillus sp. FSL K6-2393]|uniref:TetR/AcrR family transcriptional regulator n=1 Tax=Paenibacillus sp. FSL K6-2393 TaxID=2921475 RepID=UPI0030F9A85B
MKDEQKKMQKFLQTQEKLLFRLLPSIRKSGFHSLSMDEIAKIMNISRVTLYKYFSTKEEIIQIVTNTIIDYFKEVVIGEPPEEESLYAVRFQQLFEQSVSLTMFVTEEYKHDLFSVYPEIYEQLLVVTQEREKQLLTFYHEGMRNSVFNELNGQVLILQDQLLNTMLDTKYLLMNGLTIEQVLYDFYKLKKLQLFRPEKLHLVDDNLIVPHIDYLTQKISKTLFDTRQ